MTGHLPPAPEGVTDPIAHRATRLGASELAAALGYDRFNSPHSLWARKRGLLPPEPEETPDSNGAASLGRLVEGWARDWFAWVHRANVIAVNPNPPSYPVPDCDELLASPDAQVVLRVRTAGLECKWRSPYDRGLWGPPGTDQVPVDVLLQALGGMLATGWPVWYVVVVFGTGNDRAIYEIPRDEELLDALRTMAVSWVRRYLRGGEVPPVDGSDATTEALKARHPRVKDLALRAATEADEAVAIALAHCRDATNAWEKFEKLGRNRLRLSIGDANGVAGSWWKATWSEPKDGPKPKTDWEAVARAVLYDLEIAKGEDAADTFAALVGRYTTTPAPERRLVFTFDKEHFAHVIRPAVDVPDPRPYTDPGIISARPHLSLVAGADRPGELGAEGAGEGDGGGPVPDGAPEAAQLARRPQRRPRRV